MSFSFIGNKNVISAIKGALINDRLPHAVLLEGDSGLGKSTLAHYIAKSIVCEASGEACDGCRGCHLADNHSHPDIKVIAPLDNKKNISVAQARELRAEAFVKPHSAKKRVFIIDTADKLNIEAQNALLKILEEPPLSVIFILLAESRAALLSTVVSRCAAFTLSPPDINEAANYIKATTNFEETEIFEALKMSNRNVGEALRLLSGKASGDCAAAAKEFLSALFSVGEYDAIKLLHRYEKGRVEADGFIKALRALIVEELKQKYNNLERARILASLYKDTERYAELLNRNVNLPLLWSAMVCKSKQLLEASK